MYVFNGKLQYTLQGIIKYCDAYFSDKQVTFNIQVN